MTPDVCMHRVPEQAEFYTVKDIAVIMQIGESTVRNYDKRGLLPLPNRIGGSLRWSRSEIHEWIEAGSPNRFEWENHKRRTK